MISLLKLNQKLQNVTSYLEFFYLLLPQASGVFFYKTWVFYPSDDRIKKVRVTNTDNAGRVIKRKVIKRKVIPRKVIPRKVIPRKVIPRKIIRRWWIRRSLNISGGVSILISVEVNITVSIYIDEFLYSNSKKYYHNN